MANKRVHSITDRALGAYGHSPADRVGNATTGPTWGGVPPAFCTAQHVTKTARLDCAYLRACSVRNAPRFAQCGQMKGRHSAPLGLVALPLPLCRGDTCRQNVRPITHWIFLSKQLTRAHILIATQLPAF